MDSEWTHGTHYTYNKIMRERFIWSLCKSSWERERIEKWNVYQEFWRIVTIANDGGHLCRQAHIRACCGIENVRLNSCSFEIISILIQSFCRQPKRLAVTFAICQSIFYTFPRIQTNFRWNFKTLLWIEFIHNWNVIKSRKKNYYSNIYGGI